MEFVIGNKIIKRFVDAQITAERKLQALLYEKCIDIGISPFDWQYAMSEINKIHNSEPTELNTTQKKENDIFAICSDIDNKMKYAVRKPEFQVKKELCFWYEVGNEDTKLVSHEVVNYLYNLVCQNDEVYCFFLGGGATPSTKYSKTFFQNIQTILEEPK